MFDLYDNLTARLRASGSYLWPLLLRLIMFWEFWESGTQKLRGENWFADIPWADWQKGFPSPFDIIPTNLNWLAATWGELFFSVLILFGLFTRFAALSLIVITVVATAAVHWPADWSGYSQLWAGYAITDDGAGNYKLPLLFVVMLMPLLFNGGGKISADYLLLMITRRNAKTTDLIDDGFAAGLMFAVLGVITIFLEPTWGISFMVLALIPSVVTALRK